MNLSMLFTAQMMRLSNDDVVKHRADWNVYFSFIICGTCGSERLERPLVATHASAQLKLFLCKKIPIIMAVKFTVSTAPRMSCCTIADMFCWIKMAFLCLFLDKGRNDEDISCSR